MLLLCLLVLTLLFGLTVAQFTLAQKSVRQSDFYNLQSTAFDHAESGIALSLHDLSYDFSGYAGKIGTESWSGADDVGRDGMAGTSDEGEGDGVPTVGEPNAVPQPVGPGSLGLGLMVYVEDTANPDVKRILSSCTSGEVSVTLESYVKRTGGTAPRVAPVYVDPAVTLDLKVGAVDGYDRKLDDSPGSAPTVYGIATEEGAVPGDNKAALLSQLDPAFHPFIDGLDGTPSVGEVGAVDMEALFASYKDAKTQELTPGEYTSSDPENFGDASADDWQITYVNGDLTLTDNYGAGVLVVEGKVKFAGARFDGLIIARTDAEMASGAVPNEVYGAVITMNGKVKLDETSYIYYCSEALDGVDSVGGSGSSGSYGQVYFRRKS